jgi:hypothetical protein
MNIYFHIDELNRDAVVASALKKKFKAEGHRLVYGNRVSGRLLNYFHDAFDVIVMPRPHFLYDNWGESWIDWNAKFVMLSTESLGIICKDHQVMARTLLEKGYFEGEKKFVDRIDAFCIWGNKQMQSIIDFAPELADKFHVVGHPRHDVSCSGGLSKAERENRSGKISVGILPRAVGLNDYFGRSALDGFTTLLDDHFQYEYNNKITGQKLVSKRPSAQPAENLAVQAIDAATQIKIADELCKSNFQVYVRPHPKENLSVWKKIFRTAGVNAEVVSSSQPITHWLAQLDYIVGPPSTGFYDAIMSGVTPISIDNLDCRRKLFIDELWEDNNRLMPHVFKPGSISELLEYVQSRRFLELDGEVLKVLKEEADYPECQSSLDKFVNICESLVSSNGRVAFAGFALVSFLITRPVFNFLWRVKLRFTDRKENSAMFVMSRTRIRFIDELSQV